MAQICEDASSVSRDDCASAVARGLQHKQSYNTKTLLKILVEITYSICRTLFNVALHHFDTVENGGVGPLSVRPPATQLGRGDLPIDCFVHATHASINRHDGPCWVTYWKIVNGGAEAAAKRPHVTDRVKLPKPGIAAAPFRRPSPLSRRPKMHHNAQPHGIIVLIRRRKGKTV